MRKLWLQFCVLFAISCNSKQNNEFKNENRINRKCVYTVNDFVQSNKEYKYTKNIYPDFTEIIDSNKLQVAKGIYKFDQRGILRFYGFIIDKQNNCDFTVEYDSLGKETNSTGSEVIQWRLKKINKDSLNVTFLLFALNKSYSDINIEFGETKFNDLKLFAFNELTNVVGSQIEIKFIPGKTIYISGYRRVNCTLENKFFRDSTIL
jgi:hypothetical protein